MKLMFVQNETKPVSSKIERNTCSRNTKYEIKNTQRGITLVALIIAIIILLILATVSVRLVINGGIVDRANRGTQAYFDNEVQKQIKLAYAQWQTSEWIKNNENVSTFMQTRLRTSLNDNGLTVKETNGILKVTLSNGKKFDYNVETGTTSEGLPDGKIRFGNKVIGIGDQVNYDPTLNATGSTTYTSPASKSGKTGENADQSFDAATYKNAGFKWRVLDVKGGKIRLIADTDVGPGDYSENATSYYLKGSAGYINGVAELNAICGIFGHGKGAESATSITVDDVNGITGYNPAIAKYNEGQWGEYGSKVKYTRGSGNALSSVATNGKTWSRNNAFTKYFADGSKTLSTLAENSSTPQITSTYYYKSYNESDELSKSGVLKENGRFCEPYELIFGNYEYNVSNNYDRSFKGTREHSYWLASDCAYAYGYAVVWGLRAVHGASVDSNGLYYSYGNEGSDHYGVRPVVSLSSNVNIQWNATANEWQIQ